MPVVSQGGRYTIAPPPSQNKYLYIEGGAVVWLTTAVADPGGGGGGGGLGGVATLPFRPIMNNINRIKEKNS